MALITSSDLVKANPGGAVYIAQRRLYLTADRSRVVGEGDPKAAILLAAVGHPVDAATVARLGLLDSPAALPATLLAGPEPEPEPEPETKMVAGPPADKARRQRQTKAAATDHILARHPLPGRDAFAPDDEEEDQ